MQPRKRRNLLPILVIALAAVMLIFMFIPSLVVKFVDPENLFKKPDIESTSEMPKFHLELANLPGAEQTKPVDLTQMPGLRIINFWTEACQPCPAEMKNLETLQKAVGEQVSIWSISIDKSPDRAGRYADLHDLDIPLYFRMSGELPEGLSRSSAPQSWILIDSSIAYHQSGPVNWADPDFIQWIEQLD